MSEGMFGGVDDDTEGAAKAGAGFGSSDVPCVAISGTLELDGRLELLPLNRRKAARAAASRAASSSSMMGVPWDSSGADGPWELVVGVGTGCETAGGLEPEEDEPFAWPFCKGC